MTLFASGDSRTSAALVPLCPTALRLGSSVDWLRITNLAVANATVDLLLERHPHDVGVTVLGRDGDVEIAAVK